MSKDFIERLEKEIIELNEKITKLKAFIVMEKFKELNEEHQFLLLMQLNIMEDYDFILRRRLKLLKKEGK